MAARPEPRFLVGDWVLFMKGGGPVIGTILALQRSGYPDYWVYHTTVGTIHEGGVLECRRDFIERTTP